MKVWEKIQQMKKSMGGDMNKTLVCLACTLLIVTGTALAKVTEVTLYPNGGHITERLVGKVKRISAGSCTVQVDLPLEAEQNTVRVKKIRSSDASYPVEGIAFAVKAKIDQDTIADLKNRLEEKQGQRRRLAAKRESLEMRLRMWESQAAGNGEQIRSADQLLALDQAMQSTLEELALGRKQAVVELQRIDKAISEIEQEIKRIGAGAEKKRTAEIAFAAGSCPDQVEAELSYHRGSCGWEPVYRVVAQPAQGKTMFSWKAEVRQSTGQDWEKVGLTLSTSRPRRQLAPPGTGSWIIRPRPQGPIVREQKALVQTEKLSLMRDTAGSAAPAMAKRIKKSGFDLWQAGHKSVKAGQNKRLIIREYEWETTFSQLIRPGIDHRAFLKAKIESMENVMVPKGQAMMAVNGQLIGKQVFSFQGREKTLFFGDLPEITGKRVLVDKKAGEEGLLIGKKQTHTFVYRYEITNGRDEEVLIRVEDARPRTRHEDIRVELESPLAYETDENTIFWEVTIDPGQTMEIPLNVSITAPKDMAISMPR